ncbi:MAG TPA: transposase [Anaerolineales bacterium]|nr:transposase [Anaerolineales bacterium]
MFKKNKLHLQPVLISSVNELPEELRERLDISWAGVFYREFFSRLDESPFSVLYADMPSRPNVPVNVLVGLEYLKAGFGWSDEEMYDAFLYDLQVRYALGYDEFGRGYFDLRTLYYFRERLSRYMQEQGVNLLDQAFEQVTDQQIAAFQLKAGLQRMDSTQVGSNIREMGRLQLLVEVLQRVHRMLNADDQTYYHEALTPYLQGSAGQYVYRLRREENAAHIQQIGEFMQRLLSELAAGYGEDPIYRVLERVFHEHFKLEGDKVATKIGRELSAASLQSPDDLEATFRRKAGKGYRGYVANVTETCDPENTLQLITKVQVAPNHTDDTDLLEQALPHLKQRTNLDTLFTDGGHSGPGPDVVLENLHVTQIQTGLRGHNPDHHKLSLSDFAIQLDEEAKPAQITCPQKQQVALYPGRLNKGLVAYFDPTLCQACPFWQAQKCPTVVGKRDGRHQLYVNWVSAHSSQRRRRREIQKTEPHNLRAAIEATVRSLKHPFPSGKLPVRGLFRMTCLMIGSAGMINVRRIQRHLIAISQSNRSKDSFFASCRPLVNSSIS